jgi:hypothetical protein
MSFHGLDVPDVKNEPADLPAFPVPEPITKPTQISLKFE